MVEDTLNQLHTLWSIHSVLLSVQTLCCADFKVHFKVYFQHQDTKNFEV